MIRDIQEVLFDESKIDQIVSKMAKQISEDYRAKDLLLVGILKGANVFLADLMRKIDMPVQIDFMAVSSYGMSTESSGVVRILKDLDNSVEDKHVLIVEDIVDTGLTLHYLMDNLKSRGALSITACTLLDKPDRRKVDVDIRYSGAVIPDIFIVGYGIDYAEKYRNLPYIAALKPEVYIK